MNSLWVCGTCGGRNVPVSHFSTCDPAAVYLDGNAENPSCARHLDFTPEFILSEREVAADPNLSHFVNPCDLCDEPDNA